MNLPTVTVTDGGQHYDEDGTEGEFEYPTMVGDRIETTRCILNAGTYALVRVADGQTVTAEKVWWCVVTDRGIGSNSRLRVCPWCKRNAKESGCGWVTMMRGAADDG